MANPPVYQHSPGIAKPAPAAKPKAPVKVPKGTNTAPTGPTQKPAPKTGQAGLFGGQGPTAYINSLYAPQEQQNAQQQGDRLKAYQGLVSDYLNSLKDVGSQLQPYQNAASQQTADASNAAAGLAAANPNASIQAMLNAIGAPQAQKDQLTAQNQTVFNGGAALLNYTGGVIPSDQFKSDAASRASYLAGLPAIGESLGIRGLSGLNAMSSKENSDLATQKATALQKANTDLASYVQGNQKLKLQAQKTAFDEWATGRRLTQGDQRIQQGQDRLRLDATKFAREQFQQDRTYAVSLARLGISQKSLQLRIAAAAYTQAHGGYTAAKIAKFNTTMDGLLVSGAPTKPVNGAMPQQQYLDKNNKWQNIDPNIGAPKGAKTRGTNTYASFVTAAIKKGVPVQLALDRGNKIWPETQRYLPPALQNLTAVAAQAAQQKADYQQTTGLTLGLSSDGTPIKWTAPNNLSPGAKKAVGGILNLATEYLGTPYSWGGGSPNGPTKGIAQGANTVGFDCSAFAQFLYAKSGITIPRDTYDQFKGGLAVPKGQLQAGDLVFFQGSDPKGGLPGHVGIYIGHGQMIDAPHTGDVIRVQNINSFGGYAGARRYVH